jgi:hypothetical protein
MVRVDGGRLVVVTVRARSRGRLGTYRHAPPQPEPGYWVRLGWAGLLLPLLLLPLLVV